MTDLIDVAPLSVNEHERAALRDFAHTLNEGELQDLLLALTAFLEGDSPITLMGADTHFTPNQVATRLGMSRTHLYKLLDDGLIPSYRVGRDRRIAGRDVVAFIHRRQAERRGLAERFTAAESIRHSAVNELANEL